MSYIHQINVPDDGRYEINDYRIPSPSTSSGKFLKDDFTWADVQSTGSTSITSTLSATSWNNGSQRVAINGITSTSNAIAGLSTTNNATAREEAALAKFYISKVENGYITITCDGSTPSVNIVINVIIV